MMYEIGDSIVVKQTNEDGKVIEIINNKMVMIEVRGVRFPAYSDQIEYPYYKMFTKKAEPEKKKIFVDQLKKEKPSKKTKTGDGVHLQFFPVMAKDVFGDEVVDKLKVFLVNENEEEYAFEYNLFFGGFSHFDLKNTIRPLADFYLHDINFDELSENPRFEFVFQLVPSNKKKQDFFEASYKSNGKKFFKKIEELIESNKPSFFAPLFTDYPDKTAEPLVDISSLKNAGFRMYDVSQAKAHLPTARSVVDLHIEKISNAHHSLKASEILPLQLAEFEKWFQLAVLQKLETFTVIHGIGEGILKQEIHQLLQHKKEVKSFVNQYDPRYGFGATEIFLNN